MDFKNVFDVINKYNIDKNDVLELVEEAKTIDLSDEDNLRYVIRKVAKLAHKDLSDEEMKDAAHLAMADEFIDTMPEKYDYHISQGGKNVSGGQMQRLCIARAIAKKPQIYLFDDSFSALDYKTDKEVRRRLHERTKDAVTVIVAQRIGTIKDADKIVVLDDGKVVGYGNHEELLHGCEVYKEIALSQLSKEELGL